MKIPSGCKIYVAHLFDCIQQSHGSMGNILQCSMEQQVCRGYAAGNDLGEQCGAEEALTWVENLHSRVWVRMLFMDHLSADLFCKNLPRDREGIQVININIGLNNNRETNYTIDTHSYVYVSPSCCILLNNCQIKFLQVVSHTIYCFI